MKKNIANSEYEIVEGQRCLTIENADYRRRDYSNQTLRSVCIINSKFTNCCFDRLVVKPYDVCFGAGKTSSFYVDCSFDHCKFTYVSGIAKFVRCTFRNVVIHEMFATGMEFVNCLFSGKLKKAVFYGKIIDEKRCLFLKREFNQFEGNDFSQCNIKDIGFRGGIDFHKQKMPVNDNLLYIYDPDFIGHAKNRLLHLAHKGYQRDLLVKIECMELNLRGGQKHFFLDLNEYARSETEKEEIISLFKSSH